MKYRRKPRSANSIQIWVVEEYPILMLPHSGSFNPYWGPQVLWRTSYGWRVI